MYDLQIRNHFRPLSYFQRNKHLNFLSTFEYSHFYCQLLRQKLVLMADVNSELTLMGLKIQFISQKLRDLSAQREDVDFIQKKFMDGMGVFTLNQESRCASPPKRPPDRPLLETGPAAKCDCGSRAPNQKRNGQPDCRTLQNQLRTKYQRELNKARAELTTHRKESPARDGLAAPHSPELPQKLHLNSFELILINFICEARRLVEGLEQSLNELTISPQMLSSFLSKASSSFKLYCQIRKLYSSSATESVRGEFQRMCSEFINKHLNLLDISPKFTIGGKEFLIDIQPDPFALCFEEWYQRHVERLLGFVLELTEQVRKAKQADPCQTLTNGFLNHYFLGVDSHRGRPSYHQFSDQIGSFGTADLRKTFIDFFNHVQRDLETYWQRIVAIFQQKLDDFYYGDKRGCMNNLKELVENLGTLSRNCRASKSSPMKLKILRHGNKFYLSGQKAPRHSFKPNPRHSQVPSEKPNWQKKVANAYIKGIFKQIKRVQQSWDQEQLKHIADLDHPLEVQKVQKKLLISNLEHAVHLGFEIAQEQEALLISRFFSTFEPNMTGNESVFLDMIGKKPVMSNPRVQIKNVKRVNLGPNFYSCKQDVAKRVFFSDQKKQSYRPFADKQSENCETQIIDLFPEMYENQNSIFQLRLESIKFDKQQVPVGLFTAQHDNHSRLLSPLILFPKADLSLTRVKPLEVEDILAVLEDQVRKNYCTYNHFLGGWFDLSRLSTEIQTLEMESDIMLNSQFNVSPFKINKHPLISKFTPNQSLPRTRRQHTRHDLVSCDQSGSLRLERVPVKETPSVPGNEAQKQQAEPGDRQEASINTQFIKKLFSLPNKCCFQEEIHLDEKQDYSLLIMRHDDVPPLLKKFIDFRPTGSKETPRNDHLSRFYSKTPTERLSGLPVEISKRSTNRFGSENLKMEMSQMEKESRQESAKQEPSEREDSLKLRMSSPEHALDLESSRTLGDANESFGSPSHSKSSTILKRGCYLNSTVLKQNVHGRDKLGGKLASDFDGEDASAEMEAVESAPKLPRDLEKFLNKQVDRDSHPALYDYLCSKEFRETKNVFIFFILKKDILENAHLTTLRQKHNFSDSKTRARQDQGETGRPKSLQDDSIGRPIRRALTQVHIKVIAKKRPKEFVDTVLDSKDKRDFIIPEDFSLLYHPHRNLLKSFLNMKGPQEKIMFLEESK